ncbi:glycosyl transferase family 90-domain-containing protein [Mycena metata]|uniref:Glycosyl transferase family 90-domain-containing protein n=1 Tax=Mycena metata TaxID=1033252 RepID=A0AAD7NXB0_9AGAR|nr:glycosyl transferase family 90-domain-containing protein [Mycena metata]
MTSWLPTFARRAPNTTLQGQNDEPLLRWKGEHSEEEGEGEDFDPRRKKGSCSPVRLKRAHILGTLALLCIPLTLMVFFFTRSSTPIHYQPPEYDHNSSAHLNIGALYARQSSTLDQAIARYSLRNNRAPPPNYDQWYHFARERGCLIDEYHQISRDFEVFYQLAEEDPEYFGKMVNKGTAKIKNVGKGMKTARFSGEKFKFTDAHRTLYNKDWPQTFRRFERFMPDMAILLNERDEPRILFDYRRPNAKSLVSNTDPTPFEHSPNPTASFFKDKMQCLVPNEAVGFPGSANNASAFLLASASTEFTTELYPLMSVTKISPCFADILVPSEFYYSDSRWAGLYAYPNNIPWDAKAPRIYWRGKASGGQIHDSNYHAFPRFRAVDLARAHPDLMEIGFSGFHKILCGADCDAAKIKAEYNITRVREPREHVYKYKYVLDLDGNSFSGRYLGLLSSGSLVFKSTVFEEYFNDWLRPFEHYIPVLPDLSDLVSRVEWAINHDAEARVIQEAGKAFADRVLTDAQSDCYFSAVLLEWARLQSWSETRSNSG